MLGDSSVEKLLGFYVAIKTLGLMSSTERLWAFKDAECKWRDFNATHPKFRTNTILAQDQALPHVAPRVFFDYVHTQCGYKACYQRNDFYNLPTTKISIIMGSE